jgi:hypothetical protein
MPTHITGQLVGCFNPVDTDCSPLFGRFVNDPDDISEISVCTSDNPNGDAQKGTLQLSLLEFNTSWYDIDFTLTPRPGAIMSMGYGVLGTAYVYVLKSFTIIIPPTQKSPFTGTFDPVERRQDYAYCEFLGMGRDTTPGQEPLPVGKFVLQGKRIMVQTGQFTGEVVSGQAATYASTNQT